MSEQQANIKTVGKRKYTTAPNNTYVLQETMLEFRKQRGFISKGVYKFKSFEEAQEWMMQQIVKNSPATRR